MDTNETITTSACVLALAVAIFGIGSCSARNTEEWEATNRVCIESGGTVVSNNCIKQTR